SIAPADVQVPVRRGFVPVPVSVTIDTPRTDAPQRDRAEHNQQHPAEQLAASLDDERERPPQQDDRAGTKREEKRVAKREADCHAERTRAFHGGGCPPGPRRPPPTRPPGCGAPRAQRT